MPEDKLDKLKKDLYARDETADLQKRQSDIASLGIRRPINTSLPRDNEKRTFVNMSDRQAKRRKKMLIIGGIGAGIFLIVALSSAGVWWYRSLHQVTDTQIGFTVKASPEITSGDVVTYDIEYQNNSRVVWNNVEVRLEVPAGFIFRSSEPVPTESGKQYVIPVGSLQPKQSGVAHITGQLVGEQGASVLAHAEILLTPANFPSGKFSKGVDTSITIVALPIEVAIDAPKEAENGDRLVVAIHVRNSSTTVLKQLSVKVKTESGTTFAVDDAEFSPDFSVPDSRWIISSIDPLQTKILKLVLYADGHPGEKRTLDVETGIIERNETFLQRRVSHVITIAASQLAVEQLYNQVSGNVVVTAGQAVEATVKYQNTGTNGLNDVRVITKLEGVAFDASSLRLTGGGYDPVAKTITWTAASVPQLRVLQPQASGELKFTFTVLPTDKFPRTGEDLKNQTIVSTTTIDTTDTTAGRRGANATDRIVLSVKSDPILSSNAFYDDGRLGIKSTGPLPPVVGQQTSYTIRVRAGTSLNDTGEVTVTSILPDGVQYTNQIYKTTGEVRFNDRTGEVAWHIPLLPGGSGRVKPAEELYFQVAIIPAENQRNQAVPLLNKLTFEGTDEFVDQVITKTLVQDELPDTEEASPGKGSVQ